MILGNGNLAAAIRANVNETDLRFTWIAWDCELGQADWLLQQAEPVLNRLRFDSKVVISSQVPVGTCARFEAKWPGLWFAVVPENIRVATGAADFAWQDRIVFGARRFKAWTDVLNVLALFTDRFVYCSPESAEMSKHALNGFLAVSIAYANEIGRLAEKVGADPEDVMRAVMTDGRIGERAYLSPGGPPSAHLLREVENLINLGAGSLLEAAR